MKKTILALFTALFCSLTAAFAQEESIKSHFISFYGGPSFTMSENLMQYFVFDAEKNCVKDLFNYAQGGVAIGNYFSNRYGARIVLEYGTNDGACNTQQTSEYGFYPYSYSNCSLFADWIINGGNVTVPKKFNWRPYLGIGTTYSFNFSDSGHPWQVPTAHNFCLGFRYGLILEYTFGEFVGIFVDGTHEWYTDNFDGLCPRKNGNSFWKFSYGEHEGFPFDMKFNANIGLAFHF